MTKNLQIAFIVLVVLIGIYFLNIRSQGKLESISKSIFTYDPEDIFKILIQQILGCPVGIIFFIHIFYN